MKHFRPRKHISMALLEDLGLIIPSTPKTVMLILLLVPIAYFRLYKLLPLPESKVSSNTNTMKRYQ